MAESSKAPTLTVYDAETLLPRNEDGIPYLQFEQIKRVALADLTAVADYHIERRFGSVSHHIRLLNGGVIRFAYSSAGDLFELYGEKVIVAWSGDGVVAFEPLPAGPAK